MFAPKGANITDAETRSALVLLFKQCVLATPKTRSVTFTIGDLKIRPRPQCTTRTGRLLEGSLTLAAFRQGSSPATACTTRSSAATPTARPRAQASRPAAALSEAFHGQGGAGYLSGQPTRERRGCPPFSKFAAPRRAARVRGLVHVVKAAAAGRLGGDGF